MQLEMLSSAGFEKIGPSTPKHQGAQRQYQGKDSLIASLEEKYVLSQCESEMLDDSSSPDSLKHLPQGPLHMRGGMVSPHLVQAKASLYNHLHHLVTSTIPAQAWNAHSHSAFIFPQYLLAGRLCIASCWEKVES